MDIHDIMILVYFLMLAYLIIGTISLCVGYMFYKGICEPMYYSIKKARKGT